VTHSPELVHGDSKVWVGMEAPPALRTPTVLILRASACAVPPRKKIPAGAKHDSGGNLSPMVTPRKGILTSFSLSGEGRNGVFGSILQLVCTDHAQISVRERGPHSFGESDPYGPTR